MLRLQTGCINFVQIILQNLILPFSGDFLLRNSKENFENVYFAMKNSKINNIPNLSLFWTRMYQLWFLSVHKYLRNASGWMQSIPIVCKSQLIQGFNEFACLINVLYTIIYNLGHFVTQKYLFPVPICPPVSCRCMLMLIKCPNRFQELIHIRF